MFVFVPGSVFAVFAFWKGGSLFRQVFRERRLIGSLILASTLSVLAVNIASGLVFELLGTAHQIVLVLLLGNILCFTIAAFAMHLLAFEDMNYELRISNGELKTAQDELKRLATVDMLTGCYNRRFLDEVIAHDLHRRRRYGTPLSLLFIDIDRFKSINDLYGHDVGDRVLQYVGHFLLKNVRDADYVVRWGGDEFLLLLTCPREEAEVKIASLRAAFDDVRDNNQVPPGLRLSIGYVEVPDDATDLYPLIRQADQFMYADKTRA